MNNYTPTLEYMEKNRNDNNSRLMNELKNDYNYLKNNCRRDEDCNKLLDILNNLFDLYKNGDYSKFNYCLPQYFGIRDKTYIMPKDNESVLSDELNNHIQRTSNSIALANLESELENLKNNYVHNDNYIYLMALLQGAINKLKDGSRKDATNVLINYTLEKKRTKLTPIKSTVTVKSDCNDLDKICTVYEDINDFMFNSNPVSNKSEISIRLYSYLEYFRNRALYEFTKLCYFFNEAINHQMSHCDYPFTLDIGMEDIGINIFSSDNKHGVGFLLDLAFYIKSNLTDISIEDISNVSISTLYNTLYGYMGEFPVEERNLYLSNTQDLLNRFQVIFINSVKQLRNEALQIKGLIKNQVPSKKKQITTGEKRS